ncbi:rod shape-determining protein MreC [Nocardioides sp. CER19]|uniref:rod shape-determining protein MreC n=1 Tax=Nocardioides sp. CER19 TaxID=3038538 RepID=UPI00244BE396|nr:rod shape-determining protein MreC [Nocardioides sp. CER19]MDH2414053.1 rod shape-determining protein MreC [Nocardioides sp. CER19]
MAILTPERLNRRGRLEHPEPGAPKRPTAVALVLACAVLLVLDLTGPALTPARRLLGEVYGPLESAASTVARPLTSTADWFQTQGALRDRVGDLEAANAALRQEVATAGFDRNKLAEYEGLTAAAQNMGYAVVPARVIGYGASQSFSRTVTIDAGSEAGIEPDMTVVNAAGLVGRVLRVSRSTATVLLIVDADSVVGGRVGSSMEVGFVHGNGVLGHAGRLDLELLDQSVVPAKGDTVVTWGSSKGAPYVAGVPVGVVDSVYSSVRDSTQRARITPLVDFSSLDVVGVAVPSGTRSDRAVIDADGKLK